MSDALVTLDSAGHAFPVSWRPASGATGAEVDGASLRLTPQTGGIGMSLGTVGGTFDGQALLVTIPGGPRAVRSLSLPGLEVEQGGKLVAVRDEGDLAGRRVAVAVVEGGKPGAPVVTVPPVAQRGAVPPQLGGGALRGRILTLPDVRASVLQVTVNEGESPEAFTTRRFRVSSVGVRIAPAPEDPQVEGPDGSPLWAAPGPLRAPATVDLQAALERALAAALDAGGPPAVTITARAQRSGAVQTTGVTAAGSVVRRFAERVTVELAGRPAPLPLPGPALDTRSPRTALADVTVRHHGMRIHPSSDALPAHMGDLSGPVVGPDPVVRALAPAALIGEVVRRIGLVGRATEPTDLSLRLVEMAAGQPGPPVGAPGVVTLDPPDPVTGSSTPGVVWVDLPNGSAVAGPLGLSVTATRGRFLWAGGPGGPAGSESAEPAGPEPTGPEPLVLVAVDHPDPRGASVSVAGAVLVLTGPETAAIGQALAPAGFAGGLGSAPAAQSDQLCTVMVDDLTLRYEP